MPSNPEKRREQQRARRGFKSDEAPRSVKPRDEAPRKGANFPTKCPACLMAHERHCSPELVAMFIERRALARGAVERDLIDAETRAVLRAHVKA